MAVQKTCCVCGRDVSQIKRTKDTLGNYYCDPCLMARLTARLTSRRQAAGSAPIDSLEASAPPLSPSLTRDAVAVALPEQTALASSPSRPPPVPLALAWQARVAANARQNCVVMAVLAGLFLLSILVNAIVIAGGGGSAPPSSAFGCVANVAALAGLYAMIYIPIRWSVIRSLPTAHQVCGFVGGGVLALFLILQLFFVIAALAAKAAR